MPPRCRMHQPAAVLFPLALLLGGSPRAYGACTLVPQTTTSVESAFRSCDPSSPAFTLDPRQGVVTVLSTGSAVFRPCSGGANDGLPCNRPEDCPGTCRGGFALQDGDHVFFLGDSNTAEGGFQRVSESYTLLRFPTRHVTFTNVGVGGETATGGAQRVAADVIGKGATVVVVTYGINDFLHCYVEPDPPSCFASAQRGFTDALVSIINQCKAARVRVYLSSYPVLGLGDAVNDELQTFGDIARDVAILSGEGSVDVHRVMRAVVGSDPARGLITTSTDVAGFPGLHLNDVGQQLWAYALVKELGAPAEVSSVTVNATMLTGSASGATLSGIAGNPSAVRFTRLDQGLPVTFGPPAERWGIGFIPWENINAYRLTVTDLEAGTYEIRVGGLLLGSRTSTQLADGIDIANLQPEAWGKGGPWVVQGMAIHQIVGGRQAVADGDRPLAELSHPKDLQLTTWHAEAQVKLNDILHATAAPYPYTFEVRRAGP